MNIPQGYILDSNSGLYYSEIQADNKRIVTWFNPEDNSYNKISYPLEEISNEPVMNSDNSKLPNTIPRNPKKKMGGKKKLIIIIVLILLIGGLSFSIWHFEWYHNIPFLNNLFSTEEESQAVLSVSGNSLEESTEKQVSTEEESKREEESTLESESVLTQEKLELEVVTIKVEASAPNMANIKIEGIFFEETYPASEEGKEVDDLLYKWEIEMGNYAVSLMYFCEDANDTGTITLEDMQCDLWEFDEEDNSFSAIQTLTFTAEDNQLIFEDVVISEESKIDLSTYKNYVFRYLNGTEEIEVKPKTSIRKQEDFQLTSNIVDAVYVYRNAESEEYLGVNFNHSLSMGKQFYFSFSQGDSSSYFDGYYAIEGKEVTLIVNPSYKKELKKFGDFSEIKFSINDDNSLTLLTSSDLEPLEEGLILVPRNKVLANYVCVNKLDVYDGLSLDIFENNRFQINGSIGETSVSLKGSFTVENELITLVPDPEYREEYKEYGDFSKIPLFLDSDYSLTIKEFSEGEFFREGMVFKRVEGEGLFTYTELEEHYSFYDKELGVVVFIEFQESYIFIVELTLGEDIFYIEGICTYNEEGQVTLSAHEDSYEKKLCGDLSNVVLELDDNSQELTLLSPDSFGVMEEGDVLKPSSMDSR